MQLPEPRFSVMPFGGYDTSEVDAFITRLEQATASTAPTITPDQIEQVVFRSARRRGYAAAEVDQWLDLVTRALTSSAPTTAAGAPGADVAAPDFPAPTGISSGPPAVPTAGPPVPAPSPSAAVEPAEPVVGVVQQSPGLPKPVVLGLIAGIVVVIVILLYVFV